MTRKMLLLISTILLLPLYCIAQEGFLPNTLAKGIKSPLSIAELAPATSIIGRNREPRSVTAITKVVADQYIKLMFADEVIGVGCKQKFCTNVNEWTCADELRVGDVLLDITGNHHLVQDIQEIHVPVILYALTVDDHVFCIEPYGVLVHNMSSVLGAASISLGAMSITNPVTVALGMTLALSVVAHRAFESWHNQQRSVVQSPPESVTLAERIYYESRKHDLEKLKNELLRIKQDLQTIKALCNPSAYSFTYLMLSKVCGTTQQIAHSWLTITKTKELQLAKAQQQELRILRQQDLLVIEHEIIELQAALAVHSNELLAHVDACCAEYRSNVPTWHNALAEFQRGTLDIKGVGQLYACLTTQDYTLARIARIIQEACLVGDYYQRLPRTGSCIASSTTLIATWQQVLACVRSNTKWIEQDRRTCGQHITAVVEYFRQCGGSISTLKTNLIKSIQKHLSSYDGMVLAAAVSKLAIVSARAKSTATLPTQEVVKTEEVNPPKTVEDILADAQEGDRGRYCKQFIKSGGYPEALKDFESLGPTEVKDMEGKEGKVGILPDGRRINVRVDSHDERPTLEIQPGKGQGRGQTIKIRYGTK